ncbi:MAG: hypothetical protein HY907_06130 [Deltaproteobacteria bacterium]|nr:hypothetical protein [Deltaproteobacteria bacterium]
MRNPGPTLQTLVAVEWFSDSEAWAAGYGGAVVRSTDSGASWDLVDVPSTADWIAVGRASDGVIWLASKDGTRLRSADGSAWETIATPSPERAWGGDGSTFQRGPSGRILVDRWKRSWVVTNFLERIEGATLTMVGPLPGRADAFAFATETRAFVGGGWFDLRHMPVTTPGAEGMAVDHTGFIRRSDDGGASWLDPRTFFERYVRFAVFADDASGVALGGDAFVPETNAPLETTTNGGETWQTAGAWTETPGAPPAGPADLCVPDERLRRVRCTWDDGKTWFGGPFPGPVPGSESNPDGRDLAVRDLDHALGVGYGGRIYRAEGDRWVSANDGPTPHLSDLAVAGSLAVAAGQTSVLLSRNLGETWSDVEVNLPPVTDGYEEAFLGWSAVAVPDATHIRLGTRWGHVVASDDGGATWEERSTGLPLDLPGESTDYSYPGIAMLHFLDNDHGLAASRLRLFATADGCRSWTVVPLPGAAGRSPRLLAVLPSAPSPTILLSDGRALWRSTDDGRTFAELDGGGLPGPRSYFTINWLGSSGADTAWLVNANVVYRSTDAGASWTQYGFTGDDLTVIGARTLPDGTLELFDGSGAGLAIGASAEWSDPPVRTPPLPGASGTRLVFTPNGRGILAGASGLAATLDP